MIEIDRLVVAHVVRLRRRLIRIGHEAHAHRVWLHHGPLVEVGLIGHSRLVHVHVSVVLLRHHLRR